LPELRILKLSFLAVFYAQLQNDVTPTTTSHPHIKATSPFESHLIGINSSIEELI